MKTAFVSDSVLGLSPAEAQEQGIHMVMAQVIEEGKSYRDYLDIAPEQIVQWLLSGKKLTTSHANLADFQALYETLLKTHDRVLSVHVSSKLSGFVSAARLAAQSFGGRVLVLDSLSGNAGTGYVLEEARRKLAEGVSWERLEEAVAPFLARVKGLVLPKTLEYIRRSGRISGLQFFVGDLLKVLPILELQEGQLKPVERVRGFYSGLKQLARRFQKAFPAGARVTLAHADNLPALEQLIALIRSEGVVLEGRRPIGAGVTVHAGPGAVGLFAAPR
jgi:DegV family protein with EDD domain